MTSQTPVACDVRHPGAYALQTFKGFHASQCLLLAGEVADYALLFADPLSILIATALPHAMDPSALPDSLGRYIAWLVAGESSFIDNELIHFLNHCEVMNWVLLGTRLFFSSLFHTALENAMGAIFFATGSASSLVSAVLPFWGRK